ncbi:hypothetical protein KKZ58_07945 [Enterobacter kobei]|uniref:hypothetical protein n=1 Tax=Enterobacter kobei TaxID=208224 RepID=UPI001BE04D39|nr:hypothetical protein [Enterobacter kobei]MBT1947830.1 hypothetical protein [Enterobacter kobei]
MCRNKSHADSSNHCNQYLGHYKTSDGRAQESWFDEDDIAAVEDDELHEAPIHAMKNDDPEV